MTKSSGKCEGVTGERDILADCSLCNSSICTIVVNLFVESQAKLTTLLHSLPENYENNLHSPLAFLFRVRGKTENIFILICHFEDKQGVIINI